MLAPCRAQKFRHRYYGFNIVFLLVAAITHTTILNVILGTGGVTSFFTSRFCGKHKVYHDIPMRLYSKTVDNESDTTVGSRYLCLLDDFEKTRGPYCFALFDQLFEQTNHERKYVAFLTTQKDLDSVSKSNDASALESMLETLESSLDLDGPPEVFVLEDWNPLALEERFASVATETETNREDAPTILWLYGCHNAFYTRHLLRTSGFDRWIQEQCASSSVPNRDNCIFVGEGTGAVCASASMDAAKARGDEARGAPELQVYGLNLLSDGVVFVDNETKSRQVSEGYPEIEVCREDEVFVWAQPPSLEVATKFAMAPNRRGTIEKHTTLEPLSPLVIRSNDDIAEQTEGVACYGEPSVDPSRSAQAETIGDSEWWE